MVKHPHQLNNKWTNMKLYILALTLLVFKFGNIIGFANKSEGRCHSADERNYLCCRHYEFVEKSCKKCDVGYYTIKAGKGKCEPCPPNKYGTKCAFDCKCKANERCDNKSGACIVQSSTIRTLSEHTTFIQYEKMSTEESERVTIANKDTKDDFLQNLSYMIVAGVVLIVMCISISFVLVRKRSQVSEAVINVQSLNSQNSPVQIQAVEAVVVNLLNHDYEEIDESALDSIQEIQNIAIESDSDSNVSSPSKPTEDNEGYLNPYHALVHSQMESTVNKQIQSEHYSTGFDKHRYDYLNLFTVIGNNSTNATVHETIVTHNDSRLERKIVYRKTL